MSVMDCGSGVVAVVPRARAGSSRSFGWRLAVWPQGDLSGGVWDGWCSGCWTFGVLRQVEGKYEKVILIPLLEGVL